MAKFLAFLLFLNTFHAHALFVCKDIFDNEFFPSTVSKTAPIHATQILGPFAFEQYARALRKLDGETHPPHRPLSVIREDLDKLDRFPYGMRGWLVKNNYRSMSLENVATTSKGVVQFQVEQLLISTHWLFKSFPALRSSLQALQATLSTGHEWLLRIEIHAVEDQIFFVVSPGATNQSPTLINGGTILLTKLLTSYKWNRKTQLRDFGVPSELLEVWFVHTHPNSHASLSGADKRMIQTQAALYRPETQLRVFALGHERGVAFEYNLAGIKKEEGE